jgi:hypothetical protein
MTNFPAGTAKTMQFTAIILQVRRMARMEDLSLKLPTGELN